MEYWLIGFAVCLFIAYRLGRRAGVLDANRSAIQPGAWVEVIRTVRCSSSGNNDDRLPDGYQGVVTGIDKWGRVSIWISSKSVERWGKFPEVGHIEDLTSLRARPLHTVNVEILDKTLAALAEWEGKMKSFTDKYLPPGFLAFRRRFDG